MAPDGFLMLAEREFSRVTERTREKDRYSCTNQSVGTTECRGKGAGFIRALRKRAEIRRKALVFATPHVQHTWIFLSSFSFIDHTRVTYGEYLSVYPSYQLGRNWSTDLTLSFGEA
ncbi:uncharacterized protein [Prorops nasuta]|uniref:uncharacterized protein n=1 Tax=Prorops nasuta TaxID=863751 RepID=UPI0034CF24FF